MKKTQNLLKRRQPHYCLSLFSYIGGVPEMYHFYFSVADLDDAQTILAAYHTRYPDYDGRISQHFDYYKSKIVFKKQRFSHIVDAQTGEIVKGRTLGQALKKIEEAYLVVEYENFLTLACRDHPTSFDSYQYPCDELNEFYGSLKGLR